MVEPEVNKYNSICFLDHDGVCNDQLFYEAKFAHLKRFDGIPLYKTVKKYLRKLLKEKQLTDLEYYKSETSEKSIELLNWFCKETNSAIVISASLRSSWSVEIPAKFEKLVTEIEKMPVVELAELVKVLEQKFGVSAAAPVAVAVAAGPVEEKTAFNVELKEVGAKKIEVIKVVRDVTAKGLKESKDLVDAAAAGTAQMVKEGVKKEEAAEIQKKFEAAGAKVEIK